MNKEKKYICNPHTKYVVANREDVEYVVIVNKLSENGLYYRGWIQYCDGDTCESEWRWDGINKVDERLNIVGEYHEPCTSGTKYDTGKAPLDLLPYSTLVEVAHVFGFGADKYSRWNWRGGLGYSRLLAAAMRHIGEFNNGEDLDPESGRCHISHALACLMMLQAQIIEGFGDDDRYCREDK